MCMQTMDYPVFSINNVDGDNINDPTRAEIRCLYTRSQYTLRMPLSNAFAKTNLTQRFKGLQVKYIVVMGWDANKCVPIAIDTKQPLVSKGLSS